MKLGIKLGREQGIEQGMKRGIMQGIEQGKAQGIELGREQGVKQGKAQGIEQEKRETVRFMLQMNEFSLQKISEIARLPIERVKEIQEELNKKIS